MATAPASQLIRRWLPAVLAVVGLVVAAVVVLWLLSPGADADLVLVEVSGDVTVRAADADPRQAEAGQRVQADDGVRTGPGASAVLGVGRDARLIVAPETSITVTNADADSVDIELQGGRVRAEVAISDRAVRIGNGGRAVQTRDGDFDVAVTSDGVFAVQTTRGTVDATGIEGVTRIPAGNGVVHMADGQSAFGPIPDDVVLDVAWPEERRTRRAEIDVSGFAVPGSTVTVSGGGDPVQTVADAKGRFMATVVLVEGRQPVVVEAVDPFGRSISDEVVLDVDRTPPTIRGGQRLGSEP